MQSMHVIKELEKVVLKPLQRTLSLCSDAVEHLHKGRQESITGLSETSETGPSAALLIRKGYSSTNIYKYCRCKGSFTRVKESRQSKSNHIQSMGLDFLLAKSGLAIGRQIAGPNDIFEVHTLRKRTPVLLTDSDRSYGRKGRPSHQSEAWPQPESQSPRQQQRIKMDQMQSP